MSFVTAAMIAGGATLGAGLLSASAAKSAANTQASAADRAAQLQNEQFNKNIELQAPWREAGVNALAKLSSGDVMGYANPAYSFRMSEGLKALDRQAAARGGLISGGALKAAERYGQSMASDEYQNAFNRLASIAGIGQTSTNNMTSMGTANAANVGNLMTSGAAARASGYVGGANALNSSLGQYLNYSQNQNLINNLQNNQLVARYGAGNVYLPGGGGASSAGLTWNGEP